MDRNLDGFYLRIKEGDQFVNKCFTDQTPEQQKEWLETLEKEGLIRMCMELGRIIKELGDMCDIVGE